MKLRNRLISGLLVTTMAILMLSACSSNNGATDGTTKADKVYELSFSMHDPATSPKLKYYEELAAKTKEATNGAVNITIYPGGTLVAGTDAAEGVLSGTTDIGWVYSAFFPGQFPILEAISLPMMVDDSMVGSKVLQALYAESEALQEELSGYKVLNVYCNPVNYLYTTKPVNTVSDLTGMTLRCPAGVATDIVSAWGGTPILMSPGDVYQSLDKNVINGYVLEWSGVGTYKLGEVTNYCTEVPVNVGVFMALMNIDKWNSLPEEYQKIIDEIWCTEQVSLDLSQVFKDDANAVRENAINELGVTLIAPTDEQLAEFMPAAQTYIDGWIEKNKSATFDSQAYFDRMTELIEEHSS